MKYYLILLFISSILFSQNNTNQRINNSPYPFSSPIDSLIVIYDSDFSADDLFTIQILQGQLAKIKPIIYRDIGTGSSIWIEDLKENYNISTNYNYTGDFTGILAKFESDINGYILYDSNSISTAISLCGILNAIPIKEEQLDYIKHLNIIFLDDARNYTFENFECIVRACKFGWDDK